MITNITSHEKKLAEDEPSPCNTVAKPPTSRQAGWLQTRGDLRRLILQMRQPLVVLGSASQAHCIPGTTGAVYGGAAAGMEGFCRPLWGMLACAAGDESLPGTGLLAGAIDAGTDASHADFWGEFAGGDQRCVEMAVLGWGLAVAPGACWEELDGEARERLVKWLSQINRVENLPSNNWRFFRILVNLGLRAVKQPSSSEHLQQDLALIESCYLGDGWYSDGLGNQRDYYVAMAMHFYGLLIAAHNPQELGDYTHRYRERARLFAKQFIHWFAPDGSALPYGRSLTYRFAQGAFWAALAWANEEALPWGVIKGVLLRHVRAWLAEPIFDNAGVLSIGYGYANLNMAESYNSPSSPYWAMKALLPAGLPENHPFWMAEEQPLLSLPGKTAQPHPGFIICRHDDQQHITALASGQYPDGWHVRHAAAKYAKFAYGTRYGFSVPVSPVTLEDGAYDNMLAFSEDGRHWRVREKCAAARLEDDMLISAWQLWPDVHLHTWLLFDSGWQVRIHRLESGRPLLSAEAGHAVPRPDMEPAMEQRCWQCAPGRAAVIFPKDAAGLSDPLGLRTGGIVVTAPNSNLLHPRVVLPTLRGEHPAGSEWLVTFLPITCDPAIFSRLPDPAVEIRIQPGKIMLNLPSGRDLALPAPQPEDPAPAGT
jgi:hypothetical protein